MKNTTFDFGPIYSEQSQNGLPILGNVSPPSEMRTHNDYGQRDQLLSHFVPEYGMHLLTQVYNNEDGEILFNGSDIANIPARLMNEDMIVANILMLLDDGKENWPLFRMFQPDGGEDLSLEKIWNPSWLAYTELGRTIYYCYQLVDALVFAPEVFQMTSKDTFVDPQYYDNSVVFMETMKRLRDDCGLSKEKHNVHISPVEFVCDPQVFAHKQNPNRKMMEINITGFDFVIEVRDSKKSDTLVEPVSTYLSNYRHAIPMLMPVFERLRQIYTLLYAVSEIKKLGYIMPDTIKEIHKNYLYEFQQRLEEYGDEQCCSKLF
jgi:hypothetical protein